MHIKILSNIKQHANITILDLIVSRIFIVSVLVLDVRTDFQPM